jgi:pimeloyl-ACP methyl ester carboxylesterase
VLASYYGQHSHWTPCADGDQCATIRVPLDYRRPDARSIRLALLKVPATEPQHRLGSLVVNPGGPGLSGMDYAAAAEGQFGAKVLQRYDIVGFDPRGVSGSTPLHCASDAQVNAFADSDPGLDAPARARRNQGLIRTFGEGCLRQDAGLVRHVSTVEVARDLDVVRAFLGEPRLDYLGKSYGTLLGATYAHLFPTHVGRMVLDGAIDPRDSTLGFDLAQARGFEGELHAYLRWCTRQPECPAGTRLEPALRWIHALLDKVQTLPLADTGGGHLAIGSAVIGVLSPLYDSRRWGELSNGLEAASSGDGRVLRLLADESLHRDPDGSFRDNSVQANLAMWCADHDDAPPPGHVGRYVAAFEKASPTFGAVFAAGASTCALWPVHSKRGPRALTTTGAPAIMIVGTTHDPATPLAFARGLAQQLHGSVLVTRSGHGHTGYHQGNACVDDAVESYLLDGTTAHSRVQC